MQAYSILILLTLTSCLLSNEIRISATLLDKDQHPISGVNIYSHSNGTLSDIDGKFNLKAQRDQIVTFSHIGYNDISLIAKSVPNILIMDKEILNAKEVIVKSELTNKYLFNTPSSISFLNKRNFKNKNSSHFQDVIDLIPNLNYSGGSSRPRYFQIRGIGERSQYTGEGSPNFSVGYNVDGIDYSGIGMAGMLFDIKQVEVYKGPQSTIFGPNAMAGLINLIYMEPTPYFTGSSTFLVGSDNQKQAGFALGGPITKDLLFRIAMYSNNQDGFRKNLYRNLNNTNKREELSARLKLYWNLSKECNLEYTNLMNNLNNGYDMWSVDNSQKLYTFTDEQGLDSQHSKSTSLKIQFINQLGTDFSYKYINSNNSMEHSYDGDWGNNEFWSNAPYYFNSNNQGYEYSFFDKTNRNRQHNSHEFRVLSSTESSINWVIGYYLSFINEKDNAIGWLFGGNATSAYTDYNLKSTAIYIQSTFNMPFNFTSIVNLRIEDNFTQYKSSGLNWDAPISEISDEVQYHLLGGKFVLNYNFNHSLNLYSSLSQGYKTGGINQNPNLSDQNRLYKPEYSINYETGIKLSTQNIQSNLTLFSMTRHDQQVQVSNQQEIGNSNSYHYYTSNATAGENSGFELDLKLKLAQNISAIFSYGLLNTHINTFNFYINDSTEISLGNREQSMSPKYNYSLGINYLNQQGFYLNMDITGKDKYYFSDSHNYQSKPYQLLNMNIGYSLDNWTINLSSTNLFNKRYATRAFFFGNEPYCQNDECSYPEKLYLSYGDPFQWNIKLKYSF